ncbi:MAG: hypothetical protein WBC76_11870 [Actinomycetes bacterium]
MRRGLVVGILVVAALTAGCTSGGSPGAGVSQPSPSAQPLVEGSELDPGTYSLVVQPGLSVTFEVGDDWTAWAFGALPTEEGAEPPSGKAFGFWIIDTVYDDVCQWQSAPPKAPGQSAAAIARALAQQSGREAVTEPVALEVDGYPAVQIDLALSQQMDVAACHQGQARSWTQDPVGVRYHQWAGQNDRVTLVDVGPPEDPTVVAIDALWYAETSPAARVELDAVMDSVQIVDDR